MAGLTAVILAGGEGLRLRPLTQDLPKPMLPVLNRPFLEHAIVRLRDQGVRRVILALGYLPEVVPAYFRDGNRLGIELVYSVERSPLGTAGAVKNAAAYLEGTFLVFNGDIFMELDVAALLDRHREAVAQATLALHAVEDPSRYGVVPTDADGRVLGFIEKPPGPQFPSHFINSGCYALEASVLQRIPEGQPFMFEHHLFPSLVAAGEPVYGYRWEGYWRDMGTVQSYLDLHRDLLQGRATTPLRRSRAAVVVGADCQVHPTARLTGPLVLGRACHVGPGAQIVGPAVLGDGCRVEARAVIQDAVLWEGVVVGAASRLTGSVAGRGVRLEDGATVGEGSVLASGVIVPAGRSLSPGTVLHGLEPREQGQGSRP